MHALKNPAGRKALAGTLAFFGFRENELKAWQEHQAPAPKLAHDQIESLIAARNAARASKNWAESDRIRDQLAAAGIVLEDRPGGVTEWRRR